MKRRILSIFTALALCLALLPMVALAVDPVNVEGSTTDWTEGNTYTVSSLVEISTRVNVTGRVTLKLERAGVLTVTGGIHVGAGSSLTIEGPGSLTATTTTDGEAAIGGNSGEACGAITINGGTVTATSGDIEARTGGASESSGVTIGGRGAGVGGGAGASGGDITITDGEVEASSCLGAGIGGGGSDSDAGGAGGNISISGGTVNARSYGINDGGDSGAGIGGGGVRVGNQNAGGAGGNISISGGHVTAESVFSGGGGGGAGIGGGSRSAGGNITITNGTVNAKSGMFGAGIGSGQGGLGASGVITIEGGDVTATSDSGAGIGNGEFITLDDAAITITISGGKVDAASGIGAGIGGGYDSLGNMIGASTFSTGTDGSAFIVASSISNQTGKDSWSGVIFEGNDGVVHGDQTLTKDTAITGGQTLTITDGSTLTVSSGVELTNGGDIQIAQGGALTNNGTVTVEDGGTITNNGTIENNDKIALPAGSTADTVIALGLDPSGTGTVGVSGSSIVYDNSGNAVFNELDFSTGGDQAEAGHYTWNSTEKTLTLEAGFNAEKVILPDDTVTIVTNGASTIGTLTTYNNEHSSSAEIRLTLSGAGTLTIQDRLDLSGGNHSSLTVAEDANVVAQQGVTGGASGVDFPVTVDGTLKATGNSALYVGRVDIGSNGVLEVSGASGVVLKGMDSGQDFADLFTVDGDGRFTSHCTGFSIQVEQSSNFPKDGDGNVIASQIISLTGEYMPDNCEARFDGLNIILFNTADNAEYRGPLTIHKSHTFNGNYWLSVNDAYHLQKCDFEGCTETKAGSEEAHTYSGGACTKCHHPHTHSWSTEWSKDATQHWHVCTAGCLEKDSPAAHVYDNDQDTTCNTCGYVRTVAPSQPSGGGSDSSEPTYAVTVGEARHGKVTSNRRTASQSETVTLTVTPDSGYELDTLTVADSRGNTVEWKDRGDGRYAFSMPGRNVTVAAAFRARWTNPYTDVPNSAWYSDAVQYVTENGLMTGFGGGKFGPNKPLTRAQFVQILFNQAGRPVVNYLMQYNDVAEGAWYAEAVRWATSERIVSGYRKGTFAPNDPVTREQLASILWRYAGKPAAAGRELGFTDADTISGYAREAINWAVENGILNGSGERLNPSGRATRAEAADMLMRYLGN